jgi:hypothetical protein
MVRRALMMGRRSLDTRMTLSSRNGQSRRHSCFSQLLDKIHGQMLGGKKQSSGCERLRLCASFLHGTTLSCPQSMRGHNRLCQFTIDHKHQV